LGRWFWWPQVVYPRGDYHFLPPQPRRRPKDDSDTVELPAVT
jgi:putative drug exporter of the RND superfamily